MIETILFGILLTCILFVLGNVISKTLKLSYINPFLISVIIGIVFLKTADISYDTYMIGGQFIRFFLGPITVMLAIPLYKQFSVVKQHYVLFLFGTMLGILVSAMLVFILTLLFEVEYTLALSSYPKSITAPMALELSSLLEGDPNLTMMMVSFTGLTGAAFGKLIVKVLKVTNPLAIGLALGCITHVIGTSVAIQIGEEEGAISSAAIGVTGVTTVLMLPYILQLLY